MAEDITMEFGKGLPKYFMKNPSVEFLINDDNLEEIMINSAGTPVFVYHREFGMCETNLILKEENIMEFIKQAAEKVGENLDAENLFLNARLPDGSRLNATIPPATPQGATVTIRKFRKNPLSIISLIDNGTLSSELAAYLWEMVDGERNYPLNVLVIGGSGSGKTTLLNILSSFIRIDERVILIEDTPELNFFDRKNVISMESKYKGSISEITMNDLIINALRMRPDRIIVGEVRGEEAESIFNAMNVGHSAMATLHANSSAESMTRLANPPMNVPKEMLGLIDLIVITTKIRTKDGLKRRIGSVVEIVRSEIGPSFSELFSYDAKIDAIAKNSVPSQKIERLANLTGLTKTAVISRIETKKKLIDKMQQEKISGFMEVQEQIKDQYDKEQLEDA